jgi:S-adenosylmethionine:tRNA ribosyltransferase-isomerase
VSLAPSAMQTSDFDYDLPPEHIAQAPLPERDASRLLVVDRSGEPLRHQRFADLPRLLRAGDRLVVNDARVVPARVYGRREGGTGRIELLLLRRVTGEEGRPTFEVLSRPARKVTAGDRLLVGESGVPALVLSELDDRRRLVALPAGLDVLEFLNREGHVPLPPYIHRPDSPDDRDRYQTIFADRPGAVAAPTAGLHFTPALVEALARAGIPVTPITLHVGVATFTPVIEPDPRNHVMDREYYRIPQEAAEAITRTRREGGRIVAVGTTVVRALETAEESGNGVWTVQAGDGWTEKFIYPPYTFHVVDALITNFHLPRSTLLMMVAAFAGLERVRRAYQTAIAEGYRFYSYGDAMLIT